MKQGKSDAKPKKAKTPSLNLKERVETGEAAKLLGDLANGLRSGSVNLDRGGQKLAVSPGQDVSLRIKASEGLRSDKLATRGRLKIRVSWDGK